MSGPQAKTLAIVAQLVALAKEGKTRKEASKAVGLPYNTVSLIGRKFSIEFARSSPRPELKARHPEIVEKARAGRSFVDIAREYGLSRERVRQICGLAGIEAID